MLATGRCSVRTEGSPCRLALALALALVVAALVTGCGYAFKGAVYDPPRQPNDFTLTDHNGAPWRLSDQREKVVVFYFGFAMCPEVCPKALGTLAAAKRKLGQDGARIQGALVTVDPDRDTTEVLKNYVTSFDASFVGLRGEQPTLDPVLRAFSVTAYKRALPDLPLGYTMEHTSYFYAIDRGGCSRAMFRGSMKVDDLASDLRELANERPPKQCR